MIDHRLSRQNGKLFLREPLASGPAQPLGTSTAVRGPGPAYFFEVYFEHKGLVTNSGFRKFDSKLIVTVFEDG